MRRRLGEEAAGRRAEMEALRRSTLVVRTRAGTPGRGRSQDVAAADRARSTRSGRRLEADIERVDGQTSPLADRRTQLEQERRALTEKIEGLEDVERRHQARDRPAGGPPARHRGDARIAVPGCALGTRDRPAPRPGERRARAGARARRRARPARRRRRLRGRRSRDRRRSRGRRRHLRDREGRAGGARPPRRARVALGRRGGAGRARHREHGAPRRVPGRNAWRKRSTSRRAHPAASFVTPEGVLIGPGGDPHGEGGRRARARDPRRAARSSTTTWRPPATRSSRRRARLDEIGAEVDVPAGAGGRRRRRHHVGRRAALRPRQPSWPGSARRRRSSRQRVVSLDDGMAVWRERLGDAEPHAGGDAGAPTNAAAAGHRARRRRDAPSRPVDARRPPARAARRTRRAGGARSDPAAGRPRSRRGGPRRSRSRRC